MPLDVFCWSQDGVVASFMKKLADARNGEARSEAKAAEMKELLDASAMALLAKEAELQAVKSSPPAGPVPVDSAPPPPPFSSSLAAEVDRLRREAAVQMDEVTMASHALTAAAAEIRELQAAARRSAERAADDEARHDEQTRALRGEIESLQVR